MWIFHGNATTLPAIILQQRWDMQKSNTKKLGDVQNLESYYLSDLEHVDDLVGMYEEVKPV